MKIESINELDTATEACHYTAASSLQSIVEGHTDENGKRHLVLRFTDCQFLNDKQELKYTADLVKSVTGGANLFDIYASEEDQIYSPRSIEEKYEHSSDALAFPEIKINRSRYYVFCLSNKHDSSSMWSNYAKEGGYNIGLSIGGLISTFNEVDASEESVLLHGSVVYDAQQQYQKINQIYDPYKAKVDTFESDKPNEQLDPSGYQAYEMYAEGFYDEVLEDLEIELAPVLPFYKTSFHSDEAEYRFVLKLRTDELLDTFPLKFFVRNGVHVPYREVRVPSEALKSITVSPKIEYSLASQSLKQMLRVNEYSPDVIIRPSSGQVR